MISRGVKRGSWRTGSGRYVLAVRRLKTDSPRGWSQNQEVGALLLRTLGFGKAMVGVQV